MQDNTSSMDDLLGIPKEEVQPDDLKNFADKYFNPNQVAFFIGRGMVDKKGRHYLFQVRGGTKGFIEMSIRCSRDHAKALKQVKQMNIRKGLMPKEAFILVKYALDTEDTKEKVDASKTNGDVRSVASGEAVDA